VVEVALDLGGALDAGADVGLTHEPREQALGDGVVGFDAGAVDGAEGGGEQRVGGADTSARRRSSRSPTAPAMASRSSSSIPGVASSSRSKNQRSMRQRKAPVVHSRVCSDSRARR
jgi:hypothetical protein